MWELVERGSDLLENSTPTLIMPVAAGESFLMLEMCRGLNDTDDNGNDVDDARQNFAALHMHSERACDPLFLSPFVLYGALIFPFIICIADL
jgi:hypothetical protein